MAITDLLSCRERLESRSFKRISTEESLDARIARAESRRLQYQQAIATRAQDRIIHVRQIVQEQREKHQSYSTNTRLNLDRRQQIAKEKRLRLLNEQRKRCQQRTQRVIKKVETNMAEKHSIREKQRRKFQIQVEGATKRREIRFNSLIQRLQSRMQLVHRTRDQVQSAKILQSWYRHRRSCDKALSGLQKYHNDWKRLVELHHSIGRSSFEESMIRLQARNVTQTAQRILSLIPKSGTLKLRSHRFRTARVFLMAMMILHHPQEVLEGFGDKLSLILVHAAKKMMLEFCEMEKLFCLNKQELISHFDRFDAFRTFYIDIFALWKQVDGERLSGDLIQSYAEMFGANFQTTLVHADAGEEDQIHEIIMRTQSQLHQLKQAIINVLGKEEAENRLEKVEESLKKELTSKHEEKKRKEEEEEERRMQRKEKRERKMQNAAARPDLEFSRSVYTNDELVHELILNPSYQIVPPKEDDENSAVTGMNLTQRMQKMMKKAYLDTLMDSLKKKPLDLTLLKERMIEAREMILGVLGPSTNDALKVGNRMHTNVLETMFETPQNWRQMVDLCLFICEIFLSTEAPVRNESTHWMMNQIRSWHSIDDMLRDLVQIFEFIYQKVDEIRLDSINAHLKMLAPFVQSHGIEHEQKKLEEKLRTEEISLNQTQLWIEKELEEYQSSLKQEDKDKLLKGDSNAYKSFLYECFMSLIEKLGHKDGFRPESFRLDYQRILKIRNQVDMIVLKASFVALIRQTLSNPHLRIFFHETKNFCEQLDILLLDPSIKIVDLTSFVLKQVKDLVELEGKSLKELDLKTLEGQVNNVIENENPIYRLFFSRTLSHIGSYLLTNSRKDQQEWKEGMFSGLNCCEMELQQLAIEAKTLCDHNTAVYAKYYSQFIREGMEHFKAIEMD